MTIATTTNTMTDPANSAGASPIITDTNNTVTNPVVDPNPATSSGSGASSASGSSSSSGAAGGETPPPTKVTPDWAQKRINELTAKRYESERVAQEADTRAKEADNRAKAAEARAAALLEQVAKAGHNATPAPAPTPIPEPQLSEVEIERRAELKAVQKAATQRFNEACNKVVENGEKEYKDFGEAIKNLAMVGALGQNVSSEFLETAVELNNPHQILHYLGNNPEQASRIIGMPPKKMALEMARIEAQLSKPPAPPAVSGAPAPIIPVGGGTKITATALDDPNIASDDWFKERERQVAERRNRYRRA